MYDLYELDQQNVIDDYLYIFESETKLKTIHTMFRIYPEIKYVIHY